VSRAASVDRILRGARRRPHAYGTSHPLEEVELDGERFILKDSRRPPKAKPRFLHDPSREVEAYRTILAGSGLGTPQLAAADEGLLLLEKVEAPALWQIGEIDVWQSVARWAADAHSRLARHVDMPFLLRYDAAWYAMWLERARALVGPLPPVEQVHAIAVERLLAEPATVIHGEFYPSNVLVSGTRVCPVDWEMIAAGPGAVDLAALVTGWDEDTAGVIVAAYGDVPADLMAAARLHLALRWLGWSRGWSPPLEHRRDWRIEALEAAERLAERQ
jgi:aminoglycoside/choline kinase family phosphotransferase